MNQTKRLLLIAILLSGSIAGYSQNRQLARLKEGQLLPDRKISLLNAPVSSASLSDYRGKVLVLDFWATWCSSCVAKFQYVDSLMKRHPNQFQVLLVNVGESEEKISKFLTTYKKRFKDFNLPIVYSDTTLTKLFPSFSIPHYAIIDTAGVFLSTSTGKDLTTSMIQSVFNNNKIEFHEKYDFMDFEESKPLFTNGNGGPERSVLLKSMITGYLPGIPAQSYHNIKQQKGSKLFYRNLSIYQLLGIAYNLRVMKSHFSFTTRDNSRFLSSIFDDSLFHKTYYCYELTTTEQPYKFLFQKLKNDLEDYFEIEGKLEKRETKCLVVRWDGPARLPQNEKVNRSENSQEANIVGDFITWLNLNGQIPVISEVPEDFKMYYHANDASTDKMNELTLLLKKNGMKIVEENRELELFVVTDRK